LLTGFLVETLVIGEALIPATLRKLGKPWQGKTENVWASFRNPDFSGAGNERSSTLSRP
jgi:hypothetical protein